MVHKFAKILIVFFAAVYSLWYAYDYDYDYDYADKDDDMRTKWTDAVAESYEQT